MIQNIEDTPELQALMQYMHDIQHLEFVEGAVTATQILFLMDFLKKNSDITVIAETGFNCGYSTATFLAARSDIAVVSFDIAEHASMSKAKLILDEHFPKRHTLIMGNSVRSIPAYFASNPSYAPQLAFVDGGHISPVPQTDMFHLLTQMRTGSWVIADDYCDTHGDKGVVDAVNAFMADGVTISKGVYHDQDRSWIVLQRTQQPLNSLNSYISYASQTCPTSRQVAP